MGDLVTVSLPHPASKLRTPDLHGSWRPLRVVPANPLKCLAYRPRVAQVVFQAITLGPCFIVLWRFEFWLKYALQLLGDRILLIGLLIRPLLAKTLFAPSIFMPTFSPVELTLPAQSVALRSAAIFILTQNLPLRVASLKTTLYFLFRHFNAHPSGARYPVIILHEGDFSARDQEEICMGVRRNCRDSLHFEQLDASDFELPPHIDPNRLRQSLQDPPVPYWRNDRYRMMCRWWLVHFPRYAARFDYVMRLDDDSFIEEPIADPFVWAAQNGADYVSNQIHLDCGVCCLGLKSQFERLFPQRQADLNLLFTDQFVDTAGPLAERLRRLSVTSGIPLPGEFLVGGRLSMPQIFYNNFFVTRSAFWRRPDVVSAIEQLDRVGGIFYFRWGDAPIQTLLVRLMCSRNQVGRFEFRYSKRLQREAFIDGVGGVHTYVPDTYV